MRRRKWSLAAVAAAVAAGAGVVAAHEARAQGGYYYSAPSYYAAPFSYGPAYYGPGYGGSSFHFGFSTGPRYSYYRPYDYGVRPYYGGVYERPRRLEYDVYTPFGRSEVNYRFRRDGSVRVDIDD